MRFEGELVSPERGVTETLPWGVVRVAGRNRRDTVGNPSVYSASFRLVGQAMVDWFARWWVTEALEGSVPIETGIGWAQVLGNPTYSNNTGRSASVTMRLEILHDVDYCLDQSVVAIGEYLGSDFTRAAATLRSAIDGN